MQHVFTATYCVVLDIKALHILIKDLINRTMNYVNYIFNLVTISDNLVNLTCLMQLLVCSQQNILSQGCMTYEMEGQR
jgi:hypothetical protein